MTTEKTKAQSRAVRSLAETPDELIEGVLEKVSGGTKTTDKSSPVLFQACADGTHVTKATP